MKKRRTKTGLVLLLASLFLIFCETGTALASQATSYTYTLDDNDDFVRTQDAYLPDQIKNCSDCRSNPNKLCFFQSNINTSITT